MIKIIDLKTARTGHVLDDRDDLIVKWHDCTYGVIKPKDIESKRYEFIPVSIQSSKDASDGVHSDADRSFD